MPSPKVNKAERSRTKKGRWRKKRSDSGEKRRVQILLDKKVEQSKLDGDDICEWCGMTYPPGGYYYKSLMVRNMNVAHSSLTKHVICKDCYDRLEDVSHE